MCTLELYSLYWAYKNYRTLETNKVKFPRLYAFVHAFFLNLSFYRLMGLLEDAAVKEDYKFKLNKVTLAIVLFSFAFLRIYLSFANNDSIWTFLVFTFAGTLVLFEFQKALIRVNKKLRPDIQPTKKFGIFEVIFCSVCAILLSLNVVNQFVPKEEVVEYKRWKFIESSYPEEVTDKQVKITKIDEFWERFGREATSMNKTHAKTWVDDYLNVVSPNLVWDIRASDENPSQNIFVVTSSMKRGNRPISEEVIARAPKIENWQFVSKRPVAPLDKVADHYKEKTGKELGNFQIKCELTDEQFIKVQYLSPDIKEADDADDRKNALALIDFLIGQEDQEEWIGTIDTEKAKEVSSPTEACKIFVGRFRELKEKALSRRFDKPIAEMSDEQFDHATDILFAAYSTFPFDSRRYSRFNEKFCTLNVSAENPFKTKDELEAAQNELNDALRRNKCGCILGGKFDQEYAFSYELCLTDIPTAVTVLNAFCTKHNYGKYVRLQFHDDVWLSEWIGIQRDTPEPDMIDMDRLPKE